MSNRLAFPKHLVVFFIGLLLPLFVSPYIFAYRHLMQGEELRANGHTIEAIDRFRRAVSWRSPFNTFSERASFSLETIASEPATPPAVSTLAAQDLWSGLQGSRSWLMKSPLLWRGVSEDSSKAILSRTIEIAQKNVTELTSSQVHYGWQALAFLCFSSWVFFVVLIIFRDFTPAGALITSPRLFLRGVGATVGWGAWLVALSNA